MLNYLWDSLWLPIQLAIGGLLWSLIIFLISVIFIGVATVFYK